MKITTINYIIIYLTLQETLMRSFFVTFVSMDSQARTLRLLFFPLMAPGHMLPMVDMAKLFAARGVEATVLTTPANATLIRPSVETGGHPVRIVLVPFPSVEHGLPEGCENLSSIPNEEMRINFLEAVFDLRLSLIHI